ncbi:cytochrome c biogenesis protein CcsA [Bacteroidales bacterium OttesenSCG-928-B11]|nr:cytochrome c biogenesis protein CcsA [Bacteroidales bacterium OttesenSCG-928-C03]MDL2312782.1 cytochrome c biogenesis protein CcsA [Bacteroidales bacterium OttesenSCG-928-B11]MDL2325866.1 cytochrome c biogenesis protein CcsA [Bacteroidales bacterium OttesenSCG-928-A14]
MKKRNILKNVTSGSLLFMLFILAAATFVEKYKGTAFASEYIYGSWWFVVLWLIIAISVLIYIVKGRIHKRPMVFMIHLSFLVILLGAFLTFATSKQGTIHLREGKPMNTFINKKDNSQQRLPFDISLSEFQVVFYQGTQAPADYVSHIVVWNGEEETIGQISMNKIFSKNGYRFYQSGYDNDLKGSILMVKTDRFGLPVTYCGYALLLISLIGFFFVKNTGFRKLLSHPALKKGMMVLVLLIAGKLAMAEVQTLPKEAARKFGEVQMLYHDRITPIQTFAKEFTLKLYGKPKYDGYTSEQILAGWLLFPEDWSNEPMIKIKDKKLGKALGIDGKYASFTDFFTNDSQYKLTGLIIEAQRNGDNKTLKELFAADEKIQLIFMVRMGIPMMIFPENEDSGIIWYSPADQLPDDIPENEKLLIMGYFGLLREYSTANNMDDLETMLDKLKLFQSKKTDNLLPSQQKIKAERFYNQLNIVKPIAFLNILLGIFALIYFFRQNSETKLTPSTTSKIITIILNGLLLCAWLGITILICLRGYVSGHVPLGGGFETMQFLAACIMLLAFLSQRKFFLFLPFGFIFSGLALLVSGMGASNPQITQLQPVLASPLLSVHVSLMMMAYTLFGFITLNSLFSLFSILFAKKENLSVKTNDRVLQLSVISRILLYPGVFLMAAGIFVGAVWAEVSWGTYWSWDPKETWALITLIVYALALHNGIFSKMKDPLFFQIYILSAFLSVLMTYFGVNYILGGMHSYGATFDQGSVLWIVIPILAFFILAPTTAAMRWSNRIK